MKKHSLSTVFIITVSLILYVLAYPIDASYHTKAAIKLCAEAIVPTLFIFMVLSRILSHICSHKAFDGKIIKFLSTFFNIPSCIIPLCLTGIICGAPTGAFGICRMYDEGLCTKKEAEKACILASNCSAAFILGFVAAVLGSKIHTIYIFVTNTLTTLLVYLIFFKDKTAKSDAKLKVRKVYLSELITESISSSVTSTITLCGYIILFYTFIQIVCEKLTYFLSCIGLSKTNITLTSAVTASLFEVSSGILQSAKAGGNLSVVLCSGAVAFTGFSIIFQVTSIMKKSRLSVKAFILSKILCAFLCPVILILSMLITPSYIHVSSFGTTAPTFGISDIAVLVFVTAVSFTGAYILSRLDKKHKK